MTLRSLVKKNNYVLLLLFFLGANPLHAEISPAQRLYRQAEYFEKHLFFQSALDTYRQVLSQKSRIWSRRAAFRMLGLIRKVHFNGGNSEKVRRRLVSVYKSLLADISDSSHDPELEISLKKEIRWTRLGLESPTLFF